MNITIPAAYRQMRADVPFDSVSLGYTTIDLYSFSALPEAQQGYGVVPKGGETDWDAAWMVIGHEDVTGDPIFIDTNDEEFPVYTAGHGMGEWSPELIASSFRHFIDILEQVRRVAHGRETPVALERNPISETERDEILSIILRNNPDVSMDFWEVLLESPE